MGNVIPKQIYVDVTSKCNLKCKYCPSAEHPEKAREMDWGLFLSIVDKFREVKDRSTFLPWCLGEPFVHSRWTEICSIMVKEGFKWYVATNGHIWNEDAMRHILGEGGAYQLVYSVDGHPSAMSKSMELCRPGTNRDVLIGNMKRAQDLKNELGSMTNLVVKICDRGQDWQEVLEFIQFWLLRGFDYVVYGKRLYGNNDEGMRLFPCGYFDDYMMYILSDGSVSRCFYNQEALYDPKYRMDALDKDDPRSIEEIYNNSYFVGLREKQNRGVFEAPCDTCSMAYTEGKIGGEITFDVGELKGEKVYFHRDFYNSFFSLKKDLTSVLDDGRNE